MNTRPKQTAHDQPLTPYSPPVDSGHANFVNGLSQGSSKNPSWLVEVESEALVFRRLEEDDYEKGYLDILMQLTSVGDISKETFSQQFDLIRRNPDYVVIVVENLAGRIVATATLLIERKFIHQCSSVGHIEDVVVDKAYRDRKIGSRYVRCLCVTSCL